MEGLLIFNPIQTMEISRKSSLLGEDNNYSKQQDKDTLQSDFKGIFFEEKNRHEAIKQEETEEVSRVLKDKQEGKSLQSEAIEKKSKGHIVSSKDNNDDFDDINIQELQELLSQFQVILKNILKQQSSTSFDIKNQNLQSIHLTSSKLLSQKKIANLRQWIVNLNALKHDLATQKLNFTHSPKLLNVINEMKQMIENKEEISFVKIQDLMKSFSQEVKRANLEFVGLNLYEKELKNQFENHDNIQNIEDIQESNQGDHINSPLKQQSHHKMVDQSVLLRNTMNIEPKGKSKFDSQSQNSHQQGNDTSTSMAFNVNQANKNLNNFTSSVKESRVDASVFEQVVLDQVKDKMKGFVGKEASQVEIELNPRELGKIRIQIETKGNIFEGRILVENDKVREILENRFADLRNILEQKGIEVQGFGIFTNMDHQSSHRENFQLFDQENKRNSNYGSYENLEKETYSNLELPDIEMVQEGILNQVSFLA